MAMEIGAFFENVVLTFVLVVTFFFLVLAFLYMIFGKEERAGAATKPATRTSP